MRKIFKPIIITASFLLLFLSSGSPTFASELYVKSSEPPRFDAIGPIDQYPTRIWAEEWLNTREPYVFMSNSRSGYQYRGYLTRTNITDTRSRVKYEGYLYRQDLRYPIPAKIEPVQEVKNNETNS